MDGPTKEAFNDLIMSVHDLVQSLTNYVYETGEHEEYAYNSRGRNYEDFDYIAQGQDRYCIPLCEDELDNYYMSNQCQGQYFDDSSSSLNYNSLQDDKEKEGPTLAQLMSQIMAMQALQEKNIIQQEILIQQLKASEKMMETQLAQQATSSSRNTGKLPSEPDVSTNDGNTTSKSEEIFEEPDGEKRVSTEVVEEEKQPERENEEENVEEEVATHQHVQNLEAHDLSVPSEEIYLDYKTRKALEHLTGDCTLTEFLRCFAQAYREHDDTLCVEDVQVPEPIKDDDMISIDSCMKELLDERHDDNNVPLDEHVEFEDGKASKRQRHEDFLEISAEQFIKEPRFKIDTSSKDYFGDLTPQSISEQLKESTLITSKSDFEDPFVQPLPQDKFQSFLPFMSSSLNESFQNPFHRKEIKYNKGLIAQRKVPRRLGGREYKWDFKLDKPQSIHCTA